MKNIVRTFIAFLIAMTGTVTVSHAQTGPPIVDVNIVGSEASIQLDTTIPLDAEVTNEVESFVTNGPDNPIPTRDVDRVTRTPIQVLKDFAISGTDVQDRTVEVYTAPEGSMLVIEQIAVFATTTQGAGYCGLRKGLLHFPLPLQNAGAYYEDLNESNDKETLLTANESIRVYARPNTTIELLCKRMRLDYVMYVRASMVGYLIPFP